MILKWLRFAAGSSVCISFALGADCPAQFEIRNLPGLPKVGFKQYSGYMPIKDGHGTEIFFWFVESQHAPAEDPVVLWMNGGPGSSSIAFGFWTEHGPFRLEEGDGGIVSPVLYDHAWNRRANVLYIEAPTGVGYSFSTDPAKYVNITDKQSSTDNFYFLLNWFGCFETFKKNNFYITAESYGGHYGPTLAEQLIDKESEHNINMKGLMIANPGIESDWYYNVNEYSFATFMYTHALIPPLEYDSARLACGWENFLSDCDNEKFTHPTKECVDATNKSLQYVPSPLDPYNILAKTCHEDQVAAGKVDAHVARSHPYLAAIREKYGLKLEYNPCLSTYTAKYLNRPDVIAAIHADKHYSRNWPDHPEGWRYDDTELGSKKDISLLYPKFFAKRPEWNYIVISGDTDAAVPFLGTERWMECLKQPVASDWRAWKIDGDIAGMIKRWNPNLTFVSVKGCGHMIPTYCPALGYAMFVNWLDNDWSDKNMANIDDDIKPHDSAVSSIVVSPSSLF